jgi:ankyrin repeat protein
MKMDISIAELSVTDDLCFTALHHVVIGLEKADLYQQLRLNNNCINKPDSLGRIPLHWAVIQGKSNAVQALLAHGAFPNCEDKEGMTPLHGLNLAPHCSQVDCALLLIEAGADVDALDVWGRTAFRIAVAFPTTDLKLVEILIEKGADVNVRDIYDQTPLLKSIRGDSKTTQLMLNNGAEVGVRNMYGNTPLSDAIYQNRPDQVQTLLEYGARTSEFLHLQPGRRARDGLINILHFTAWYGGIEVMQALEGTRHNICVSPRPIDDFDDHRNFRLAHGLENVSRDREAFAHLLSTVRLTYGTAEYANDLNDDDDDKDEEEVFVDAHDYPQNDATIV